MLIDMQFEGGDRAHRRIGNPVLRPPVDDAGRHVHEDIKHDCVLPIGRAEEFGEQRAQLRPDAFHRFERFEQGVQQIGARHDSKLG